MIPQPIQDAMAKLVADQAGIVKLKADKTAADNAVVQAQAMQSLAETALAPALAAFDADKAKLIELINGWLSN